MLKRKRKTRNEARKRVKNQQDLSKTEKTRQRAERHVEKTTRRGRKWRKEVNTKSAREREGNVGSPSAVVQCEREGGVSEAPDRAERSDSPLRVARSL